MSTEIPPETALTAILVSYNSRQLTLKSLAALSEDLKGFSAEICVVDNASTDGSADAIRSQFPDVKLIANDRNAGFGAANNQIMKIAAGKFFLLLNTDAFVGRGTVMALINCLDRHPRAAVAGPQLINPDGSLQQSCFRFPSPVRAWMENLWLPAIFKNVPQLQDYRHWKHDREREVDWVGGACMLVRREAYENVGGFDERFFLYSEETDWQRTMRNAGWQIVFTPSTQVVHVGAASGTRDHNRINPHFFDSLDKYELKNHGTMGFVSVRAAMIVGCAMRSVVWTLVWLFVARRRDVAWNKMKLHAGLLARQSTSWRISNRSRSFPSPGVNAVMNKGVVA